MKIAIGTNTFNRYDRQDISVDALKHLAQKFDQVEVYDVQFSNSEYDINCLNDLKRSSEDLDINSTKRLPFVNDILQALSRIDCDYFVYVNSDVIISTSLIRYIINNSPDSFACSRVDIKPIDNFQQFIDKRIEAVRYEIAGFDVFVFKRDWYLNNQSLFDDFLVGQPCWDQCYAMMLKLFGGGHSLINQYPPFCFHIQHEPTWQLDKDAPERLYNHSVADRPLNKLVFKMFDHYLTTVLVKRQPYGSFLTPVENEKNIEAQFFSKYIS